MKKSEELKQQMAEEDNDIKAFGIGSKVIREQRSERFEDKWLSILISLYDVLYDNNGKYTIKSDSHGVLDYFPKANKLLIRNKNKWVKPGLKWITKNLISVANGKKVD